MSLDGDHSTLLNIYKAYANSGFDKSWCDSMCLQARLMQRAKDVRTNLRKLLSAVAGDMSVLASCQDDLECVRRCLVTGYFSNAAQLGIFVFAFEYVYCLSSLPCRK